MSIWHPNIPVEYRDAIIQGDLLRLLITLPDDCVDAVVTDPPYSSGGQFRGDRVQTSTREKYLNDGKMYPEFLGDTRDQRSYHYWVSLWLAECWRVSKPGSPIMIFTDWRQLPVTTDAVQAGGWVWRGIAVWDKTEAVRPHLGRFRAQCEYIVWGSKGAWWADQDGNGNLSTIPGVIRKAVRAKEKKHITGKPVQVMRWLISACPPNGIILDPCIGSGTTARAALESNRHFIGFELSPDYRTISEQMTNDFQRGLL